MKSLQILNQRKEDILQFLSLVQDFKG